MKKLEQSFQRIVFIEIIFSILYAFFGLIVFLNSEITNKIVGVCIGTFFIVSGLVSVFSFIEKSKIKIFHYNFIFGILSIAIGLFSMFNPLSILNILNISLGVWLLVESGSKIVYFGYLNKINSKSAKVILGSSCLLFFLGIMIILNPFRSLVITKTIGIFILLYNILNISDLMLFKRNVKNIIEFK